MSAHVQTRPRPAILVVTVGALLLLLALATRTAADSDLWGHLRFGLDTLQTGSLPSEDPYSFTQDRPWINHEWLSELQMGIAYTVGGVAGLALLKGLLVASALALVWGALHQVALAPRIVTFAFVVLATVPVTRTLRPQLWSLLALAILCRVLVEHRTVGRRWLPVLFALWANVHGGWIVGLGVLGTWTAAETGRARRLLLEPAVIGAACVLATLCTPYGWTLWTFILGTVRMGRDITEWQPLWNSPPVDAVPWVVAVIAAVWLLRQSFTERWPSAAVVALLAYSSVRVIRVAPLFVACAAVLLAPALAAWHPRRTEGQIDSSPGEGFVAVGLFAITAGAAFWVASDSLRCLGVESARAADPVAVRVLADAPPGRMVTFFDWGQYALWHLGPEIRVSMDGRRETVYSDVRLEEHAAILEGRPEGLAVLAAWKPEYVWLPASSESTRGWLLEQGYRLEHDSVHSFVAVRPDLPHLVGRSVSEAEAGCFPG
jgi:hypothetical protein